MNNWTFFERVVILSTPKYAERLERCQNHLDSIGLFHHQTQMSDDILPDNVDPYTSLNNGEDDATLLDMVLNKKSCNKFCQNLSRNHYNAIIKAYDDGVSNLLIFEDDAVFDTPIDYDLLYKITTWLKSNDWDVFYFGQLAFPNPFMYPVSTFGIFRIFNQVLAHAYALNRSGMKVVIDNYTDTIQNDVLIGRLPIRKYTIIPSLCYQNVCPGHYKIIMRKLGITSPPLFKKVCIYTNIICVVSSILVIVFFVKILIMMLNKNVHTIT